ncbi:hypothetical protein ACSBR1_009026 [Camellia fascicularis]
MKLMSWNVRGLGKSERRRKLKEIIRVRKLDFVLLQETKKVKISKLFVRSLWSGNQMAFMAMDIIGNAGTTSSNFNCTILNVYASNDMLKRRSLWELLFSLKSFYIHPWCIGGDFNEVKNIGERKGCVTSEVGMKNFGDFIEKIEAVDLPMLGRKYTWDSSQDGVRWSKINRFIVLFY